LLPRRAPAGLKGALQSKLLSYLGEPGAAPSPPLDAWKREQALQVVRNVYCRAKGLPVQPAAPAAAPAAAGAPPPLVRPPAANARTIRCVCQRSFEAGPMVQCQEAGCGVWQHRECVLVASAGPPPAQYLCETCRVHLADPFWEPLETLLPPARLPLIPGRSPVVDTYGVHPYIAVERTLYLNDQQLGPARADPGAARVQAACVRLGDAVAARMHWPRYAEFRVNAIAQKVHSRNVSAPLGVNQRDAGASIAQHCVRGRNTVSLVGSDAGAYVLVLQRCRRRSAAEVQAMMAPPEALEAAVARVRRLVGAGAGDAEVVVAEQVASLKDPMSGQRLKVREGERETRAQRGARTPLAPSGPAAARPPLTPRLLPPLSRPPQVAARFSDASGLGAFDLASLMFLAERGRKWQDPLTLRNSTVRQLQPDAYIQRVLDSLSALPQVTDVEINTEGLWRPLGSAGEWWSVLQSPEEVRARVAAPAAPARAPRGGREGGAGADADAGGIVVEDSETDEEEELRQAAAAVRPAAAALAGVKRPREPEVISLLSSDDDDDEDEGARPPAVAPPAANGAAAGGAGAAGGGSVAGPSRASPLTIRLPQRGAQAAQQPPPPQQQQQRQQLNQQQLGAQLPGAAAQQRPPTQQRTASLWQASKRAPAPGGGRADSPTLVYTGSQPRQAFSPAATSQASQHVLSQQAQQALREETDFLAANPDLIDGLNEDWNGLNG
jgi:hypothetical protein